MCWLSSVKMQLTPQSDTSQRQTVPKAFARISEDVTANLHKARQENALLKEDVPALFQDSGKSVVFEEQMLPREDEIQLGKLSRLKDYATIHCCKMEVKFICYSKTKTSAQTGKAQEWVRSACFLLGNSVHWIKQIILLFAL